MESWSVGDVVEGVYEVRKVLGYGGMSVVHEVYHREWGRSLAVKAPLANLVGDEISRQRYVREAQIWVDLGVHPNISTCWYVRLIADVPHVFHEIADGGTLKTWTAPEEATAHEKWKQILDFAIQACDGLGFAHARGVVHRDVKPANLLIAGTSRLMVSDFGIAHLLQSSVPQVSSSADTAVTGETGCLRGTMGYMAPEQYGTGAIDARADIYSLGVVLFELLCGRRPFFLEAAHPCFEHVQALTAAAPNPRSLNPNLPEDVASVVVQCLSRSPDERPPKMLALREALSAAYFRLTGNRYERPIPEEGPLRAASLNNRALSFLDLGHVRAAMEQWQKALELSPDHPETVYNFGLSAWRRGDVTDKEFRERLLQLRLGDTDLMLGFLDLESLAPEQAESRLERAIETGHTSQDVATFKALGWSQLAQEKFGEAASSFSRALELSGNADVDAHGGLNAARGKTRNHGATILAPAVRRLWTSSERYSRQSFEKNAPVLAIASETGRILCGSPDGTVGEWDLETGHFLNRIGKHNSGVAAAAFAPDGRRAVTQSTRGDLILWERLRNRCDSIQECDGRSEFETCTLVFSADGSYFLSGGPGRREGIQRFEVSSGKRKTIARPSGEVTAMALLPDGVSVLVATRPPPFLSELLLRSTVSTLSVWNMDTGQLTAEFSGFKLLVKSLVITADGQQIITVSDLDHPSNPERSKRFHIDYWDAGTRGLLGSVDVPNGMFSLIAVTSDGAHAVCGGVSELQLWNLKNRRCIRTIEEEGVLLLNSIALSQDGAKLLEADRDGRLHLRELAWGRPCYSAPFRVSAPLDFSFVDLNRTQFIAGLARASALLEASNAAGAYAALTGARRIPGYEQDPEALALAAALSTKLNRCGLANVWLRKRISSKKVGKVIVTRDGASFLTLGSELKLWDFASGKCRHTFNTAHSILNSALDVSADGHYLVAASSWDSIGVWDLITCSPVSTLDHQERVNTACVLQNGRFVISGSGNNDRKHPVNPTGGGRCSAG